MRIYPADVHPVARDDPPEVLAVEDQVRVLRAHLEQPLCRPARSDAAGGRREARVCMDAALRPLIICSSTRILLRFELRCWHAAAHGPIIGLTLMLRCGGGRGARADHRVEAHALHAVVRARRYQVNQVDDEHKDAPAMHHTPQHTPHHRERRVPHTTAYAASP